MIDKLKNDCFLNDCVNYSVYNVKGDNLQDLLCNIFAKINEVISDVNIYTNCIKETIEWIKSSGLESLIIKEINSMYESGKFNDIISDVIFLDLRNAIEENKNSIEQVDKKVDDKLIEFDKQLQNKFNELSDKINNEVEKFNNKYNDFKESIDKKIEEQNKLINGFNDKLENNKNDILQINKELKKLDFNFDTANHNYLMQLDQYCERVIQSLDYDNESEMFYVSQVYDKEGASKEANESFVIFRCDKYGRYIDNMKIEYGGHGAKISIEHTPSGIKLWTWIEYADSTGVGTGGSLCRIPYLANATIKTNDINIERFTGFSPSEYLLPDLDEENGIIAMRYKISDTQEEVWVSRKEDIINNTNKTISKFSVKREYTGNQGLCTFGGHIYWRAGFDDNNPPALIVDYDYNGNINSIKYEDFPMPPREDYREPEGLTMYIDKSSKKLVMIAPVCEGGNSQRKTEVYGYFQPIADAPRRSNSPLMTALFNDNNTFIELPKNIKKLRSIEKAGFYYASTKAMQSLTDIPEEMKERGAFIRVSPTTHFYPRIQEYAQCYEVIQNSDNNVNYYVGWGWTDGLPSWYKVNLTKL